MVDQRGPGGQLLSGMKKPVRASLQLTGFLALVLVASPQGCKGRTTRNSPGSATAMGSGGSNDATTGSGSSSAAGATGSTVVESCSGQACGTPCQGDPYDKDNSPGWCDGNGRCVQGSATDCPIPCITDADCPPVFVGQNHGQGGCDDPSFETLFQDKCLQHFCRWVSWPICPEGTGDASKYFHYDETATSCDDLLPQIEPLFEAANHCDPTLDPSLSCHDLLPGPCCAGYIDNPYTPEALDYFGRISQATDMGCDWQTCDASTCPPRIYTSQCESSGGKSQCSVE